eukprot:jgi/Mesvir1/20172/Mv13410-RA.1
MTKAFTGVLSALKSESNTKGSSWENRKVAEMMMRGRRGYGEGEEERSHTTPRGGGGADFELNPFGDEDDDARHATCWKYVNCCDSVPLVYEALNKSNLAVMSRLHGLIAQMEEDRTWKNYPRNSNTRKRAIWLYGVDFNFDEEEAGGS